MPNTEKKPVCFVIAPIGANDSDIRKRSDKVLKHIFRKALTKKYKVVRGDEIEQPGMITSQVLRAVQDSDLVVADLTGLNANVMYELAVRHSIEKPIIHMIEPKLSKIPFDIAGFRAIEFDLTDPDSIESAVEQLKNHADAAEKGNWGETPVKLANIMQRSKEDSPEMLLLKEVVAGVAELRARTASYPQLQFTSAGMPIFGSGRVVNLSTLASPNAAFYGEGGVTISNGPFETQFAPAGAPPSNKNTYTLRDLDAGAGKGLRTASRNALRDRIERITPEDKLKKR